MSHISEFRSHHCPAGEQSGVQVDCRSSLTTTSDPKPAASRPQIAPGGVSCNTYRVVRKSTLESGAYAEKRKIRQLHEPKRKAFFSALNSGQGMRPTALKMGIPGYIARSWVEEFIQSQMLQIGKRLLSIVPDIRFLPRFRQAELIKLHRERRSPEILRRYFAEALGPCFISSPCESAGRDLHRTTANPPCGPAKNGNGGANL